MKTNRADLKDVVLLLFISIMAFIAVSDSVFPIIIIAMKAIFYIFGFLMGILGLTIIARSIFGKKNKDKNADKHNAI